MFVFKKVGLLASLYLLSMQVLAQSLPPIDEVGTTAHEVVRQTSEQVMQVVEDARVYAESDPERYYLAVHEVLDPVIDFRGFARSVMGPYASKRHYQSLDDAGRSQLREQLERFTGVIRENLVRTYGKGLLAFGGSRIEVSQPTADEAAQPRVSVRQLIYSDQESPYILMYQMGRNKAGDWKLRNVIIETVNLGEIYKNQFQAAAREHDGNLNAVIDGWTESEEES